MDIKTITRAFDVVMAALEHTVRKCKCDFTTRESDDDVLVAHPDGISFVPNSNKEVK